MTVLRPDASLSSPGSVGITFPQFTGRIEALRLPTPISPHFVSFVWRYRGCHSFSLLDSCGCCRAKGWDNRLPSGPGHLRGEDRISQVTGEPTIHLLLFFDPGRIVCLSPCRGTRRGPRSSRNEGSNDKSFSRPNSNASELAAYASSGLLPPQTQG